MGRAEYLNAAERAAAAGEGDGRLLQQSARTTAGALRQRRVAGAGRRFALIADDVRMMQMLADGYRDKDLATALNLSYSCVQQRVKRLLDKVGADTRTQAVAIALRGGLIE